MRCERSHLADHTELFVAICADARDASERQTLDISICACARDASGRELADALDLTSSAAVRKKVNALRTAGYPIVATQDGYSIATDSKQIEDCIRSLRSRVASIESAIAGLYKSYGAVAQ